MRFFFYGTLLDPDVRSLVLGLPAAEIGIVPATLRGWRAVCVDRRTYPAAVRHPRHEIAGVVASGLPDAALERLTLFEGDEYALARLDVEQRGGRVRTCHVFVAGPRCRPLPRPWRFEDWKRRHAAAFVRRLRAGEPAPGPARGRTRAGTPRAPGS